MAKDYTTTKVRPETLRLARIIGAHTRKSMIDVLHRLVVDEVKRLNLQQYMTRGAKDDE